MTRLQRHLTWNAPLFRGTWIALAGLFGLALVRLTPFDGFLLVFFALVAVGTVIEPLCGLVAALFLGVLWAWLRSELPAVPPLIAMPVLGLTLTVWLLRGAIRRQIRLRTPLLFFPLALFCGAAALSLWDAVELPIYGLPELLKWLQVLALLWLVADYVDTRRLPWLVGGLLVIGVFEAAVGLWQFGLRGTGPDHFAILNGRFYRAYGTFEQPNPYAGYLGLVFSLGAGMLLNGALERFTTLVAKLVRRGRGVLAWPNTSPNLWLVACLFIGTGLLGGALIASWSRGAWLGLGAALLAMTAALPRRAWLGPAMVLLVLAATLVLHSAGLLPASLSARLTDFTEYTRFQDVRGIGINDANYAVIERLAHWQAALTMWRDNFGNGVGFGDYEPAYPEYRLLNWPIALGHAHNYYLNVAAETGVIGLAAYLGLWGAVVWQTWRITRRTSGWQRGLAIGLFGAWAHLSVHHLFDNLYVNNVHLHVGVMLGLVAVLARINTQSRSHPCVDPIRPPVRPSVDRSG